MKKLFLWCIKIIPLLTIVQGVLSGGSKLGPVGNALQTAMTQYEVSQILTVLSNHPDVVAKPETFTGFLQEHFHNQYSILARSVLGQSTPDLSKDIWGKPFHLQVFINDNKMKMGSNGPDGLIDTKDDVAAVLTVDFSGLRPKKKVKKVKVVPVEVEEVEESPRAELALDQVEEYQREPAADVVYAQDQYAQDQRPAEASVEQEPYGSHEDVQMNEVSPDSENLYQ